MGQLKNKHSEVRKKQGNFINMLIYFKVSGSFGLIRKRKDKSISSVKGKSFLTSQLKANKFALSDRTRQHMFQAILLFHKAIMPTPPAELEDKNSWTIFVFSSMKGRSKKWIVTILSGRDHSCIYPLGAVLKEPKREKSHTLLQIRLSHNLTSLRR